MSSQQFGPYLLQKKIASGASSHVHLALHKDKSFALKIFRSELLETPDFKNRITKEIETSSQLKHPNILRVIESLAEQEQLALVCEYIDGESLESLQNKLSPALPEIALLLTVDCLHGIDYAHSQGVIHRDIKPANLLFDKTGRVVVADFGIAKVVGRTQVTLHGSLIGSPDYMSPEQAKGQEATMLSDLFSMASVLYFLTTGKKPFSRDSALSTLAAVANEEPIAPNQINAKISPQFSELILKGLRKNPADRYQSAGEFISAIEDYLHDFCFPRSFSLHSWYSKPNEETLKALHLIGQNLESKIRLLLSQQNNKAHMLLSYYASLAPNSPTLQTLFELASKTLQARTTKKPSYSKTLGLFLVLLLISTSIWLYNKNSATHSPVAATQPQASGTAANPTPTTITDNALPAPLPSTTAVVAVPSTPTLPTQTAPTPKPLIEKRTSVHFDVSDDVKITWNGKVIEDPSRPLRVLYGKYRLKLEKPGLAPIERTIDIRNDEPINIRVK